VKVVFLSSSSSSSSSSSFSFSYFFSLYNARLSDRGFSGPRVNLIAYRSEVRATRRDS
jgi:hypothetical protein